MEKMKTVNCTCGALINVEDICYNNGCNEEGEEYGVVYVECESCKKDWETSRWGEWDSKEDAVITMCEYINNQCVN